MPEKPAISIIVCTYNRADYLRDTLISLLQTEASPASFELLIVDNNSSDKTPDVVQNMEKLHPHFNIKYYQETQQGLSHARNCGIQEASAPILLFLDDDIKVKEDFIPHWLSFFEQYPNASGGGGKIHVQFDDPRPAWMSHFLLPLLGHHDLGNSVKKYPAGKYPFGGNMAFRKEIFETYGSFDTDLGRKGKELKASEEKELYQRITKDKMNIYYLPEAALYHRVSKQRLTKDYIKKQAQGLGASIALQLKSASLFLKLKKITSELTKLVATIFLCIGYLLGLQFATAAMLLKFRGWIWEGYFEVRSEK